MNERCVLGYHSRNYKISKLQKRCQLIYFIKTLNTVGLIFRMYIYKQHCVFIRTEGWQKYIIVLLTESQVSLTFIKFNCVLDFGHI